jgi:hypothetical protein
MDEHKPQVGIESKDSELVLPLLRRRTSNPHYARDELLVNVQPYNWFEPNDDSHQFSDDDITFHYADAEFEIFTETEVEHMDQRQLRQLTFQQLAVLEQADEAELMASHIPGHLPEATSEANISAREAYDEWTDSFKLELGLTIRNWVRLGYSSRLLAGTVANMFGININLMTQILEEIFFITDSGFETVPDLLSTFAPQTVQAMALGPDPTQSFSNTIPVTQNFTNIVTVPVNSSLSSETFLCCSSNYIKYLLRFDDAEDIFSDMGTPRGFEIVTYIMEELGERACIIRLREAVADRLAYLMSLDDPTNPRYVDVTPTSYQRYMGPAGHLRSSNLYLRSDRRPTPRYSPAYVLNPPTKFISLTMAESAGFRVPTGDPPLLEITGKAYVFYNVPHPLDPSLDAKHDVYSCSFYVPKYMNHIDLFSVLQLNPAQFKARLQVEAKSMVVGRELSMFLDGQDIVFVYSHAITYRATTCYGHYGSFIVPVQSRNQSLVLSQAPDMITPLRLYGMIERAVARSDKIDPDFPITFPVITLGFEALHLDASFSTLRSFYIGLLAVVASNYADSRCVEFKARIDRYCANSFPGYNDGKSPPSAWFAQWLPAGEREEQSLQAQKLICAYYHVITIVRFYLVTGRYPFLPIRPIPTIENLASASAIMIFLQEYFTRENIPDYIKNFDQLGYLRDDLLFDYLPPGGA